MTSKSFPLTALWSRVSRPWILVSGATETAQSMPMSATIIPYFLSAFMIAWTCGGKREMSKLFLSRRRSPIRGRYGSLSELA